MALKIEAAKRLAITAAREKMQTSKYAHDEIIPVVFGKLPNGNIETYVEGMEITFRRAPESLGPSLESKVKSECDKIKHRAEGKESYTEGIFYDGNSESEWVISVFSLKSAGGHVTVSAKRKDGLGITRYEDDSDE